MTTIEYTEKKTSCQIYTILILFVVFVILAVVTWVGVSQSNK